MALKVKLPSVYKRLLVTKLSTKFGEAVELVSEPMPTPGPSDVLVKNRYVMQFIFVTIKLLHKCYTPF